MSVDLIEPWIRHAIGHVLREDGVLASSDAAADHLLKFGRSEDIGTSISTVWQVGANDETYVSSNIIDTISSSNAGDTQLISLLGFTVDGDGNFERVVQVIALSGQDKVPLATPIARVARGFNSNTTDLNGDVYVYEDDTVVAGIPQTLAKIHMKIPAAQNQSSKMASTVPKNEYWLLGDVYGAVSQKTAAAVDFDLQIREKGKVFRTKLQGSANSVGAPFSPPSLRPFIIVKPNSDIRVRALTATNNVAVVSWLNGVVMKVIT